MGRNTQLGGCTSCPWYRWWCSRTRAASARSTSTRGCCASGWCSSATAIDDDIANLVVAQLLHLEAEDPDKDIQMYVNSPGGVVYAGLAIYDTMRFIKPDVATICCGIAMSMGSLILAGGAPGKRSSLPEQPDPDPPAVRRLPGPGDRHPDPRPRGARAARAAGGDLRRRTPASRKEQVSVDLERDRFFTPARGAGLRPDRPRGGRPQQRQRLLVVVLVERLAHQLVPGAVLSTTSRYSSS